MRSTAMRRAGWTLTGLFGLFMLGASIAPKLVGAAVATDTLVALGWPGSYTLLIGLIELSCLILYLLPRTNILGAVLMTALLGGSLATQLRVGSPLFSHTLFSVYLGLFMWGGLWLRDAAVRALFPIRLDRPAE
ncbi:DoxX family protein [Sphingomonas sp. QA11]|uniref:DoxX family protein n=1 Tax=Sphingomonas sp. QA11 TaxID=2950605 RepID=UPI00234A8B5C|nr:DoxX family protein [Sphingomonas sp. QA11]WCM29039.1 DoxX family protein [Sphingomonas sp. QA11]